MLSIVRVFKFKECFRSIVKKLNHEKKSEIYLKSSNDKSHSIKINGGSSIIENPVSSPSSTEKSKRASLVSPTKFNTNSFSTINQGLFKRADRNASTFKIDPQPLKKSISHRFSKEDQVFMFNESQLPKESRVGKRMADLTTKRVTVLVLLVLFFIPFISYDFFHSTPIGDHFDLEYVFRLADTSNYTDETLAAICKTKFIFT